MNFKKTTLTLSAFIALSILCSCGTANTSSSTTGSKGGFSPDKSITVITREDGSGTRGAFTELFGIEEKDANGNKVDNTTEEAVVANKTDVMLTNVSGDMYSIGYVSLGSLNDKVKALNIDGAEATAENVKNNTYKIARPFNIATKDNLSETAQDFIDFILSKDGQDIASNGYIPVNSDASPYSGTKPAGKIVVAGSSSVSPLMEKLKEAYLQVNTNADIEIQTNDSTSGINGAIEGTCDIGMASRDLKESESSQLKATAIALDGIAVIVNSENPTNELTSDDVKDIFTGTVTTWSEIEK